MPTSMLLLSFSANVSGASCQAAALLDLAPELCLQRVLADPRATRPTCLPTTPARETRRCAWPRRGTSSRSPPRGPRRARAPTFRGLGERDRQPVRLDRVGERGREPAQPQVLGEVDQRFERGAMVVAAGVVRALVEVRRAVAGAIAKLLGEPRKAERDHRDRDCTGGGSVASSERSTSPATNAAACAAPSTTATLSEGTPDAISASISRAMNASRAR